MYDFISRLSLKLISNIYKEICLITSVKTRILNNELLKNELRPNLLKGHTAAAKTKTT